MRFLGLSPQHPDLLANFIGVYPSGLSPELCFYMFTAQAKVRTHQPQDRDFLLGHGLAGKPG